MHDDKRVTLPSCDKQPHCGLVVGVDCRLNSVRQGIAVLLRSTNRLVRKKYPDEVFISLDLVYDESNDPRYVSITVIDVAKTHATLEPVVVSITIWHTRGDLSLLSAVMSTTAGCVMVIEHSRKVFRLEEGCEYYGADSLKPLSEDVRLVSELSSSLLCLKEELHCGNLEFQRQCNRATKAPGTCGGARPQRYAHQCRVGVHLPSTRTSATSGPTRALQSRTAYL
ncbi:hypothetical protein Pelo_11977 [Pelomyxa schiedti]|nr:hypothetical protein Pelo_11977 [Pelomyxa schiedti]